MEMVTFNFLLQFKSIAFTKVGDWLFRVPKEKPYGLKMYFFHKINQE